MIKNCYAGRIKVVCSTGKTSFAVDPDTFEPITCEMYDPEPRPEPEAVAIISHQEWTEARRFLYGYP